MIQKRKMETTKNEDTVKLVLPFSYFLWMLGTNPDAPIEKTMQQESQAKQENLKSATPFPKCYLHKEKWTFDS